MNTIIRAGFAIAQFVMLSAFALLAAFFLTTAVVTDIERYPNKPPRIMRTPLYEAVGTTDPTLSVTLGYTFTTIGDNLSQMCKDYWRGAYTGKDVNNYASLSGVWTHDQLISFQGAVAAIK